MEIDMEDITKMGDEIERLRAEAEMWKASHDSAVKEAYKKRCALQAKITILSDLLTDKCDELREAMEALSTMCTCAQYGPMTICPACKALDNKQEAE